jgi:hypothetical protein
MRRDNADLRPSGGKPICVLLRYEAATIEVTVNASSPRTNETTGDGGEN